MSSKRIDISDWVIHFVHKRNPENDANNFNINPETGDGEIMPDDFTYIGEPIYKTEQYEEEYVYIESDASAFSVLKKILQNGYIKSGWSFRNGKPTIYGPKSAVCFTEMPLYGLIEYAKTRNSENSIQDYGIAFLKQELFNAGARQVIYGLSTNHEEADSSDPYFGIGLRTLSSKCGLGLREQYRYVTTNLAQPRKIDWTHEREWRWADIENKQYDPGLPFFSINEHFNFTRSIVIVRKNSEAENIVDYLKMLFDAKSDIFGREYDTNLIKNTFVLSIESLETFTKDIKTIRLDDLPLYSLPKIKNIIVRHEVMEKVKAAWTKANELAYSESKKYYDNFPAIRNGERLGCCGFSHVTTSESHSEITEAFIKLGIAKAHYDRYVFYGLKSFPSQLLDIEERAAKVAAEYLQSELGQNFYYESKMD